eukprot:TRINITY_DN29367_c0_g1_i6.p1 TRINITY_DN29367_c0_g1~~TRINITY_DN29367_c0_g1_i6.p1  ORF type:complete len:135 (-),score=29.35 TRINITY_DN29367_c0_g1_i6:350-754(-)
MYMTEWLKTKGVATHAPCEGAETTHLEEPCEDVLLISEACHNAGGDQRCSCAELTKQHDCDTVAMVENRTMNVTEFCLRTCGKCPARAASLVGQASDENTAAAAVSSSSATAPVALFCLSLLVTFVDAVSLSLG